MFAWILKSAIISVLFIFLIHHLIKFFKNMLTTPKIKDFVTRPTQKYEQMLNAIHHTHTHAVASSSESVGTTNLEDLSKKENNMKEELKQYLKTHLKDDSSSSSTTIPSTTILSSFEPESFNLF